jgi:light-regulated signal transduction histidine kinase (bacteriophytochrome)
LTKQSPVGDPRSPEAIDPFHEIASLREHLDREIEQRKRTEEALRQMKQELERSNRDLEKYTYVASHDLQEPLRMVVSYVQLIARRYRGKLDADADEFIRFAEEGATRMHRLLNDLLVYAQVDSGDKGMEPFSCEALLEQVLVLLQIPIRKSRAVITWSRLPTVTGDRIQVEQLFQHLIGNAIKFAGPAAPRIHVSAQSRDPGWMFSVRDNGIGIAPEYTDRIFSVFQRLHSREKYEGNGIGLALCKKIVERHGGRIWVESEPDKGSTFVFTFHTIDSGDRTPAALCPREAFEEGGRSG